MSVELLKKPTKFVHSVKVPRIYKVASKIFKQVSAEGGSLKQLLYSCDHVNKKVVLKLVSLTLKNYHTVDFLLKKSRLLKDEERLDPWLAGILVTELLYGKKQLKSEAKPIQTILSYKKRLNTLLTKSNEGKDIKPAVTIKALPRYVRVNTLKATPDEVIKRFREEGWRLLKKEEDYQTFLETVANLTDQTFVRDFHLKYLLVFPAGAEFFKHELYLNGTIILQDKASCLAAHLLQPPPGSVVFDTCAAPGMKTTCLAAIMKNKGEIHASEQVEGRYKTLQELVSSCGCNNVHTINQDSLSITRDSFDWCTQVQYILVDPTCSGSGMKDRINLFAEEKSNPKRLRKLAGFQFKLLHHALTSFPKVQRVVYSTCSTYTEENESVVARALSDVSIEGRFKLIKAMKEWPSRGCKEFKCGKKCLVASPEKDFTNGFFIAVFERRSETEIVENSGGMEKKRVDARNGVENGVTKPKKLKKVKVEFEEDSGHAAKSKKLKKVKVELDEDATKSKKVQLDKLAKMRRKTRDKISMT